MYRRPKFLDILLQIRRDMALEADYDVDLFAEIVRSGPRMAPSDEMRRVDRSDIDEGSDRVEPVNFQRTGGVSS